YKGPRALSPGQQLIIPHQSVAAAPAIAAPAPTLAPILAPPASKPVAAVTAPPTVHVVNRGDTLMSIAHRNHVPVAELAKANGIDTNSKLTLGQKINVPAPKSAATAPVAAQPAAVASAQPAPVAAPATKMAAAGDPVQKARLA